MAQWAYYNNDFIAERDCKVPATDLAVQRGYGIFDFFKIAAGTPLFLDQHLTRFYASAEAMRLPVGKTKMEIKAILAQLISKNNLASSGIRLTLTGGHSSDGFSITAPNFMITQQPLLPPPEAAFERGIRLATYPHQRQLPHVKTIDYLMAIWLQPWLLAHGADDVLYHNHGQISECPRANFFIVTADGTIRTPAEGILNGITRMLVLQLAGERICEQTLTLPDIEKAGEAFITSTTKPVVPVTAINGIAVGDGRPGPVTRHIAQQVALETKAYISKAAILD